MALWANSDSAVSEQRTSKRLATRVHWPLFSTTSTTSQAAIDLPNFGPFLRQFSSLVSRQALHSLEREGKLASEAFPRGKQRAMRGGLHFPMSNVGWEGYRCFIR